MTVTETCSLKMTYRVKPIWPCSALALELLNLDGVAPFTEVTWWMLLVVTFFPIVLAMIVTVLFALLAATQ